VQQFGDVPRVAGVSLGGGVSGQQDCDGIVSAGHAQHIQQVGDGAGILKADHSRGPVSQGADRCLFGPGLA
jgi:hypothetical protein